MSDRTDLITEAERLVMLSIAEGNPVGEFGVTKEIAFVRGVRWAEAALTNKYENGDFEISPDSLIQDRETFQEDDPDFEIDPEDLKRLELTRRQRKCPYSHELDSCSKCGWRRSTPEFTPTTMQVCYGYSSDPEAEYRDTIRYPGYQLEMEKAFYRWLGNMQRLAAVHAWDEGHRAGRDYQGDGWNSDAHDPWYDNPYRKEDQS